MPKADLSNSLASAGGSTRRKAEPAKQPDAPDKPERQASARVPITVHFPREVRDQLKILAVEQGKTLHRVCAEAYNDYFAKHGKPEVAPLEGSRG